MTPRETVMSINKISSYLIREGFSDSQNYPRLLEDNRNFYVDYSGFSDISKSLKNIDYTEIYDYLDENNQYNFKLIDGALVHLLYTFDKSTGFSKQRLCYFPAPNFEPFQNDPELYLDEGNMYADVVNRSILPVPIRVDFAPDDGKEIIHPISHLTLGQYKNCRIPMTSPLCPVTFMKFILSSFYGAAFFESKFSLSHHLYDHTIFPSERNVLHLSIE
ncbi:hypothetical protein SAMN05216522_101174 [Rosenbergiella nectarea]|uniref:DUF2290 domain-containing protein n=1 Tax=Rosenbergiella nectarea TaxID=988801 RepID=A0A1H9D7M7_9GAMM|nr:DUF2290 domain-containing protein [Rosenbergiella nectarea]SEQ09444.1 hypothetical protein SAMN05216522_101174 [Rosenbergiella nectarea]